MKKKVTQAEEKCKKTTQWNSNDLENTKKKETLAELKKQQHMYLKNNKYIKNISALKRRLHGPLDRSEQVKDKNILKC